MKILFTILAFALCTTALSETTDSTTASTPSTEQTTKSSESTTSELPTTSSTEPTTTSSTEKSTTTSLPTTSSTTAKPVTSSSTSAPPTPTPTPIPAPEKCSWNVTESNVTCIRAEMKARFIIDIKSEKIYINLGCDATLVSTDCSSNATQALILHEEDKYTLTMLFEKEKDDKFSVKNITLDYVLPDGEKGFALNDSDKLFNVKIGNSYLCRSESEIHLGNVTMQVSELHIQAFGDKGSANFGSAEECDADDKVSGIIPIAVGVALAALIIIVLIAYLIGRKRSRQRGYQSV